MSYLYNVVEAKYPIKTKTIVADFSNSSEEFYQDIAEQLVEYPIGILGMHPIFFP